MCVCVREREKERSRRERAPMAASKKRCTTHVIKARDVLILGEELGWRLLLEVALLLGRHDGMDGVGRSGPPCVDGEDER